MSTWGHRSSTLFLGTHIPYRFLLISGSHPHVVKIAAGVPAVVSLSSTQRRGNTKGKMAIGTSQQVDPPLKRF